MNRLVKGKMKQIDLEKVLDLDIPILDDNVTNKLLKYLSNCDEIIKNNILTIETYKKLKDNIISLYIYNDFIELIDIVNLSKSYHEESVVIVKNGNSAGDVYFNKDNISPNCYYLTLNNNNFLIKYIYHYMVYKNDKLKELSNLTQQPNLSENNLLSLKIPNIPLKQQINIVEQLNLQDFIIDTLFNENQNI
jgi:restriction endonuclease S subunit